MALTGYTWPAPSVIEHVRVQKDFLQGNRAELVLPKLPLEELTRRLSELTEQLAKREFGAYADVVDGRQVLCITGFARQEDVLSLLKEKGYTSGTPQVAVQNGNGASGPNVEEKLSLGRRFRRFLGRNSMRVNAVVSAIGHYASIERGKTETRIMEEIRTESSACEHLQRLLEERGQGTVESVGPALKGIEEALKNNYKFKADESVSAEQRYNTVEQKLWEIAEQKSALNAIEVDLVAHHGFKITGETFRERYHAVEQKLWEIIAKESSQSPEEIQNKYTGDDEVPDKPKNPWEHLCAVERNIRKEARVTQEDPKDKFKKVNRHSLQLLHLLSKGADANEIGSIQQGAGKNQNIGGIAAFSLLLRTAFGSGKSQLKFEESLGELHSLLAEANLTIEKGNFLGPELVAPRYTAFDGSLRFFRENTTPITEVSGLVTDALKAATGIKPDLIEKDDLNWKKPRQSLKEISKAVVNPTDYFVGLTNLIGTAIAVFVPEKKKSIIPPPPVLNPSPFTKIKDFITENPLSVQGILSVANKPFLLWNAHKMHDPERRKWSLAASGAYTVSRIFNIFASKMGEAPTQTDVFDPLFAMTANTLLRVPEDQRPQAVNIAVMALTNSLNASLAKNVHISPEEIETRLVRKVEEVRSSPLFSLPPLKDGVVPETPAVIFTQEQKAPSFADKQKRTEMPAAATSLTERVLNQKDAVATPSL